MIAILGAGLAGLSCAYHLRRPFRIFEKTDRPGGLASSVRADGFTLDHTGHLLHLHRPEIRRLVLDLLAGKLVRRLRRSHIYIGGRYSLYPFQSNLYGQKPDVVEECLEGFIRARVASACRPSPSPSASFLEWIYDSFGAGIARHFMVPYNEKVWAVPLSQMTLDWMGRFVPPPRLDLLLEGAYRRGRRKIGYNATFLYPKEGGIQALADAFAEKIQRRNAAGKIEFLAEASEIDEKRKTLKVGGEEVRYSRLVSTIPLPALVARMRHAPAAVRIAAGRLRANSVLNFNLGVARPDLSDKHWIYFPEKRFPFYRVGFYRNFCGALCPPGCSSLYAEVSVPPREKPDPDKWRERVKRGLRKAGILRRNDRIVMLKTLILSPAYVIFDKHRNSAVRTIQEYLRRVGILSIGRFGEWNYSSMEDAMASGRWAAISLNR